METTYTTADFSPINNPDVKPEHIGRYAAFDVLDLAKLCHRSPHNLIPLDFLNWNGQRWAISTGDALPEAQQNQYWFGLVSAPTITTAVT